jgi:hypothetical protein
MKRILAAILLMVCTAAHAQSTPPPCLPTVNGYPVGEFRYQEAQVGVHVFFMCESKSDGQRMVYTLSCPWAKCSRAVFSAALISVTRASAKVGTAHALWKEHVAFDCNPAIRKEQTQRGALCREQAAILLANHKAWGMP